MQIIKTDVPVVASVPVIVNYVLRMGGGQIL